MRRTASAALILIGLTACDAVPELMPDTRLEVNDFLREKCTVEGTPLADDLIYAVLVEVDAALEIDAPKYEILQLEMVSCITGCVQACERIPECDPIAIQTPCQTVCVPCMAAIVEQVYR